jgi:UDP-N-acetylglucosamine--N-acetylmuramyl-(pentapeptide) pyrophosphoryl-undecaprenol N-acetylglucosamine transferase
MRIILAGGGTGGPVTPLLAVAEELKSLNPDVKFLFIGTKNGPERRLVAEAGIEFISIPAAKWRRYFSFRNVWDFFVFTISLIRAYAIVSEFKPDLIFSVGGFVAVPVAWTGKLKGATVIIHQQDAFPGLANKLISPVASVITTAFEKTAKEFATHRRIF